MRHTVVLSEPDELLVHPRLGRLTRELAQVVRESASGAQRLRRGLLEADFYGLRDWRSGDSRRWIHWRTSARRGALVVRQFEQRRSQDLAVLVDLWCPISDACEGGGKTVETAVSFVATLVADACSQPGRQMILHVSAAEAVNRAGAATAAFLREQMDALAVVEPHQNPKLPDSLARALALVSPDVPTLVVSTRPIDLDDLEVAAAANDVELGGRRVQIINVSDPDLARYYRAI
jgi:uncharacterized protein (DUF58 family)